MSFEKNFEKKYPIKGRLTLSHVDIDEAVNISDIDFKKIVSKIDETIVSGKGRIWRSWTL